MNDAERILTTAGKNTQSSRIIRFTCVQAIRDLIDVLRAYIFEAIEIEKAGLRVEKNQEDLILVEELQSELNSDFELKTAFDKLTPGRKRGYNMFFSAAKQSKTRKSRIYKYRNRILKGKGINDCVCGKSKRMPNCDGSHK